MRHIGQRIGDGNLNAPFSTSQKKSILQPLILNPLFPLKSLSKPIPYFHSETKCKGKARNCIVKKMASTSAVSMAMPLTCRNQKLQPSAVAFLKPLPVRSSTKAIASSKQGAKFEVKASSFKEKAVTGLTAAAITASMVIPEVAQAADGVSPSLKNFLLSIVSGGVVVVAILGAIIGVSNFDPVKRT